MFGRHSFVWQTQGERRRWKFGNVQKCSPIGGRCWHTGRPLSTPLGSSVVFQQVGLRAAFCEPRPRLSLIEMLWGCIGKVDNPLPKPLGPCPSLLGQLCFQMEPRSANFSGAAVRSLGAFHISTPFSQKSGMLDLYPPNMGT